MDFASCSPWAVVPAEHGGVGCPAGALDKVVAKRCNPSCPPCLLSRGIDEHTTHQPSGQQAKIILSASEQKIHQQYVDENMPIREHEVHQRSDGENVLATSHAYPALVSPSLGFLFLATSSVEPHGYESCGPDMSDMQTTPT